MPLPRLFGVGLCVLMVTSTVVGQIISVRSVAAQSVTAATNAELRSGPGYDYPVLSTVSAGAPLSIDGPPAAEFYPVTVNGQSGWLPGAILNIVKDTTVASTASQPATQAVGTAAPVSGWEGEQVAPDTAVGGEMAAATMAPVDLAATAAPVDPAAIAMPADTAPPAAEAVPPPAADATTALLVATPAAPASQETGGAVGPATTVTAAPQPAEQTGAVVAEQTPVPSAAPSPAPTVAPAPVLTGSASVPEGGNLFYAPDPNSGVVFWVPAGSTVERLGEERNGYVRADYMAMVGWIAADRLAEPVAVTAEVIPESAPVAENVRTPRPGSGIAFATVELTLRAGPSANEASLGVVPAGARIVMTGVMENGFHRVDYQGTLGWVASDYLSTPPNPTETPTAGDDWAFSMSRYERTYTREEIVAIIYEAADRYGQSRSDMLRVAECESALDPYAVHPSGSYGLFQFIRTTWKSTPYGDQNVFNPRANSNAAAWMWSQGRRSEWVCK